MKQFTFYFDFLSPFSYFAWMQIEQLKCQEKLLVNYKPVALGPLLNHWRQKGPGEIDPKRIFLLKQCLRYATKNNIPFTTPKTHPFNSLYTLRLALLSTAGELQNKVIAALWKAGWQKRIDMGEPEEILNALRAENLPAEELYEKSFSRESKLELKTNIQEAIHFGAFGVPTFICEGELFWGNDSIPDLLSFTKGNDPLDREKLEILLNSTPRAGVQQIS